MVRTIAPILALLVAGCAVKGPETVVSSTGATARGTGGTVLAFSQAYNTALCSQTLTKSLCTEDELSRLTKLSDTARSEQAALHAYNMVAVGSDLSLQLCLDFFKGAGREQQFVIFGKDFLGIAGAIVATVIGATSGSAAAVTWTGLATTGGISGLNLYERNFLFSSDNIDAVESLTRNAVVEAGQAAKNKDARSYYTFSSGVSALMEVQRTCEVQNVLKLVRQAINGAKTQADEAAGAIGIDGVRASLGRILFSNVIISKKQLLGLYVLLQDGRPISDTQKVMLAKDYLRGLSPSPLTDTGANNSAFDAIAGSVQGKLELLSKADREALATQATAIIGGKPDSTLSSPTSQTSSSDATGTSGTVPVTTTSPTLPVGATAGQPAQSTNIDVNVIRK